MAQFLINTPLLVYESIRATKRVIPCHQPANPPARILHILGSLPEGGVLTNHFALLARFDRASYEVHLATALPELDLARSRIGGAVFHPVPWLQSRCRPWRNWRARKALVRVMRDQAFDLVHTWTPEAGYWGRLAATRCRVPVVVHTHLDLPLRLFTPAWKRALFIVREHRTRPVTDYFIASSDRVREQARQHRLLDWNRSQVVCPGIDYAPLDERTDTVALRRELAVPESWSVVFMTGPMGCQRAQELMVEAIRELMLTHPRTLLLISGTGPRRARLDERITRLNLTNHVRLIGRCIQVPPLIKAADAFALSPRCEDLGQAIRVAMLLGKPVVAPDVDGISELVQHGETGLLYEAGKAHQLASHLRYLLDHPTERYRLGVNARRLTRPRFDINTAARRLEQIYDQLLRAKCHWGQS